MAGVPRGQSVGNQLQYGLKRNELLAWPLALLPSDLPCFMARKAPAKIGIKKKSEGSTTQFDIKRDLAGALPCLVVVVGLFALLGYLFYLALRSAS